MASSGVTSVRFSGVNFTVRVSTTDSVVRDLVRRNEIVNEPGVNVDFCRIDSFITTRGNTPTKLCVTRVSPAYSVSGASLEVSSVVASVGNIPIHSTDSIFSMVLSLRPNSRIATGILQCRGNSCARFRVAFGLVRSNKRFVRARTSRWDGGRTLPSEQNFLGS